METNTLGLKTLALDYVIMICVLEGISGALYNSGNWTNRYNILDGDSGGTIDGEYNNNSLLGTHWGNLDALVVESNTCCGIEKDKDREEIGKKVAIKEVVGLVHKPALRSNNDNSSKKDTWGLFIAPDKIKCYELDYDGDNWVKKTLAWGTITRPRIIIDKYFLGKGNTIL